MPNDLEERQRELESQLVQLQRHIEQQDREMLVQANRLLKIEAELKVTRDRLKSLDDSGKLPHEKPPHY